MIRLPEVFQNGMVLQRDKPVRIWGSGEPGSSVTVSVQGQRSLAEINDEGKWQTVIPALSASDSETLTISDGTETIVIDDVAVGEVWLAGGQSNMEFFMRYEKHLNEVRPSCANDRIRFFDVPEIAFDGQAEAFDYSRMGFWRKATPEDIEYFSAVGYYFQRDLEKELDVPVGIIGCNWGGTVSISWMNEDTVKAYGGDWWAEYEKCAEGREWDAFWEAQKKNPIMSRGTLFEDPFSEFVMPRTPSPEEVGAFFAKMADFIGDFDPSALMPEHFPGALYEHMLKTVAPYTVRGVLWYQGESDEEKHHADIYEKMLTYMISDWRSLWAEELPFLIVQLPGFESWLGNSAAEYDVIREAQEKVCSRVSSTALCSISDSGEQFDIHPKNKLTVGKRLALLARGHVYGEKILCDPPVVKAASREGGIVRISFANAGSGLHLDGGHINALSIYINGEETGYEAEISGSDLMIRVDAGESDPILVRFARTQYFSVNLYNEAGIPAIPFELSL